MQATKLTLAGTAFIGLGALLSVYFPPFKRPVDTIENGFKAVGEGLSSVPVLGTVFRENPVTNHPLMSRFLAVSTFETILAGGTMLGTGAIMKLMGVLPKDIERAVQAHTKNGNLGR